MCDQASAERYAVTDQPGMWVYARLLPLDQSIWRAGRGRVAAGHRACGDTAYVYSVQNISDQSLFCAYSRRGAMQ